MGSDTPNPDTGDMYLYIPSRRRFTILKVWVMPGLV